MFILRERPTVSCSFILKIYLLIDELIKDHTIMSMNICCVCLKPSFIKCNICNLENYCNLNCQLNNKQKHDNYCNYFVQLDTAVDNDSYNEAMLQYDRNNFVVAEELFSNLLQQQEQQQQQQQEYNLINDDILIINCMSYLGRSLNQQQKKDETISQYEITINKCSSYLGSYNYETLLLIHEYCDILKKYNEYNKAEKQLNTCLDLCNQYYGENFSLTIKTMDNLATIYSLQMKFTIARTLYEVCLNKMKLFLPLNHETIRNTTRKFMNVQYNQEKQSTKSIMLDKSSSDIITEESIMQIRSI